MKHIFQTYQKKLTNLATSSRSLFLPRLSSLNDLDLHEVDYLENKASFSHIAALIEGKSPLVLCKKNDANFEQSMHTCVNFVQTKAKKVCSVQTE